ncbi:MAG: SDR family NAD(P)-dependent oxidoreductase [Dehalococcoidia bacterium]
MTAFSLSLKDKVAIVTGASGGLGRAAALALADAGARVVGTDIDLAGMENTASEIESTGGKAVAVRADVTKKPEVDAVVEEAVKVFGTIDILVNNAGVESFFPLMRLREDGWDRVFDVNVKGYYLFAQAAGRIMMHNKRGSIIQIGSGSGKLANPYSGAYCASKAAVEQLSRVLAVELGYSSVRVNCIMPGFIRTGMLGGGQPDNGEMLKRLAELVPLHRIAEPDDVAAVILFLASDMSSYVNGASIYVDGGVTLTGFNIEEVARSLPPKYRDLTILP